MKSTVRRHSLISFITLICLCVYSSCVPDTFDIDHSFEEGVTDVQAEVVFSPITDALTTRATDGAAIKKINSLCILMYRVEDIGGNREVSLYRTVMVDPSSINQTGNTDTPSDAVGNGEHQAETQTPKARFAIDGVENGNYYIYAVANMGNVAAENSGYDVSTPEKLKEISLIWDEKNIPSNNQMFGYFTSSDHMKSQGFEAPLITITNGANQIHAWVKRAASKVTVAIDGSGLYDGVQVYIKSIQIKDIPRTCWLGQDNTAANKDLIEDGEEYTIPNSDQMNASGPMVTKQQPYYYPGMSDNTLKPENGMQFAHSETQQALYFFENMQGEGQSKKQVWPDQEDKTKPMFPMGNDPLDKGFKDNKKDGTYIEVTGYYKGRKYDENDKVYKPSEGPIIYRFMLGKDTDKDYNAQRNYHYKLTLKLLGNANDTDWHIVYDPEPDVVVPNPYYISYLYDRTMNLPLKIMGKEIKWVKAEIVENGWGPINAHAEPHPVYWTGSVDNPGVWNGFLSLRKTSTARFGMIGKKEPGYWYPGESGIPAGEPTYDFNPGTASTYTFNKVYWDDKNRGYREYTDMRPGKHKDSVDGDYSVSTNGAGEWEVQIPLYTRAAVMVEQTGYTGNNPYVAYRRQAKVKIIACVVGYDGVEREVECRPNGAKETRGPVTIYQMRRVVNPKGIWRKSGSVEPFHVQMLIQESEFSDDFKPLYSDGPWMAEIAVGKEWFDIEPTEGVSRKNPDGTISGIGDMYAKEGETEAQMNKGRIIDFTFKPKGVQGPVGGAIRIYYNNYTCVHLIFVRQGYQPVSFYNSTTKWHASNLKTASEEVDNPVLEGSYFRRYNTELPIAASNNQSSMFGWSGNEMVWKDNSNHDFAIAGTSETRKWSNIRTSKTQWDEFKVNDKTCRLATPADVDVLTTNSKTIYGYGVLYTDGTTRTITSKKDAYGAVEGNNVNRGMRGVFICDSEKGTQIFLPIGATGYGRFKQKAMSGRYNRQREGYEGVNQYANRWAPMGNSSTEFEAKYKPLLWDIYRREGALYWISNGRASNQYRRSGNSIDINYYSFNFYWSTVTNLGTADWTGWAGGPDPSGEDALLLRLVED